MKTNKKAVKILSVILAVALVSCGVIGVVYASAGSDKKPAQEAAGTLESTIADAVQLSSGSGTNGKEETVYVIADAAGHAQNVVVSDWLKNPDAKDKLEDYSELTYIKNTNGDQTFTSEGGSRYVWNAGGSDIHYQGSTQKQLPVTVNVSYQLDGKDIAPAELSGKNGHVTIRFNYTNTQKESATIDGAQQDIYVPFLMVSGLILDNDMFSNVKVKNGTVYNDGSRNIVLGYALPGLSQSLNISEDDFEIPEYVQIDADTTSFALDATLTVGMTNLFDNVNIDTDGSIDELTGSLDDLEDAALQLIDGASDLYSGTSLLHNSCDSLKSGAGDLLNGAKALNTGAGKVNTGAHDLSEGLGTLSKNSATLNAGAKKITDAVFSSATSQLREKLVPSGLMTQAQADAVTLTPSGYVAVFQQLSNAVTVTPEQVESKLRGSLTTMTTDQQNTTLTMAFDMMAANPGLDYTTAVAQAAGLMADAGKAQTALAVIDAEWLGKPENQLLISQVKSAVGTDDATAAKIAAIALALNASDPASSISQAAQILSHAAAAAAAKPDLNKISMLCASIASASTSTGNASLDAVKKQLDDVMAFNNGLLNYSAGVDNAYVGSKTLASGASELKDGVGTLLNGVTDLYAGSKKLASGAGDLKDGSLALKDGISEFYQDGIKKIIDTLNGDYKPLFERLKAVADAGRSYKSFSGISEDIPGTVRFIFRTDAV